jgi:hypothetical protein
MGVILGILLLLLLIGLVVLQGMIEWGGFDLDKWFGKKTQGKDKAKETKKPAKKAKKAKKKGKK